VRTIARFDFRENVLVKSRQLEGIRPLGPLGSSLQEFSSYGLPAEIWLNAITASFFGTKARPVALRDSLEGIFLPKIFGGGIESVKEAETFFSVGADRIALNTAALRNPALVTELSKEFGSQAVVGTIEARKIDGSYMAFGESGRWNSRRTINEWADELVSRGVGELVILSVETEGTGQGFPEGLMNLVSGIGSVPIILSGGFGSALQVKSALSSQRFDGVAVSKIAHQSIDELRKLFGDSN
jgi:imidazole glycerol-phosphate synthase subunit HisF